MNINDYRKFVRIRVRLWFVCQIFGWNIISLLQQILVGILKVVFYQISLFSFYQPFPEEGLWYFGW